MLKNEIKNKKYMFCKQCENLLQHKYDSSNTVLHCNHCNIEYEMRPEDTLVYHKTISREETPYLYKLRLTGFDPVAKKIQFDCLECNSKYSRVERHKNGNLYYVCTKCANIYIYRQSVDK